MKKEASWWEGMLGISSIPLPPPYWDGEPVNQDITLSATAVFIINRSQSQRSDFIGPVNERYLMHNSWKLQGCFDVLMDFSLKLFWEPFLSRICNEWRRRWNSIKQNIIKTFYTNVLKPLFMSILSVFADDISFLIIIIKKNLFTDFYFQMLF